MEFVGLIIGLFAVFYILFLFHQFLEYFLKTKVPFALGFAALLVVIEITALPFFALKGSFIHWLILFFVIMLAMFWRLPQKIPDFSKLKKLLRKSRKLPFFHLAILLLLISLGLTMIFTRVSLDDSLHLSLITQNYSESSLNAFDSPTGSPGYDQLPIYSFLGWELMQSSISYLTSIDTSIVAHSLMPILVLILGFAAYHFLFSQLFKKKYVWLMLSVSTYIFLFSGYSRYAEGMFIYSKSWQGKIALLHIIMPLLFAYLVLYMRNKKLHNLYIISLLGVAGFALNPTAIYLIGIPVTILAFILSLKLKSIKRPFYLMMTLLPLAALALILRLSILSSSILSDHISSGGVSLNRYKLFVSTFAGSGWYLWIYLLSLPLLFLKTKGAIRWLLVYMPIILMLSFANPFLAQPVAKYITATSVYWRLFWLIPAGVGLSYIITAIYAYLEHKQYVFFRGSIFVLIIFAIIPLGGTFVFSADKFNVANDLQKLPTNLTSINNVVAKEGKLNVLASYLPSSYLRSEPIEAELVWSRHIYMEALLGRDTRAWKDLRYMTEVLDGYHAPDPFLFPHLLNSFEVDYIIYDVNSPTSAAVLRLLDGEWQHQSLGKYLLLSKRPS